MTRPLPRETFVEDRRRHAEARAQEASDRVQEASARARALLDRVYSSRSIARAAVSEMLTEAACQIRLTLHAVRATIAIRSDSGEWQLYHAALRSCSPDTSVARSARLLMTGIPEPEAACVSLQTAPATADPVDIIRIPGATSSIYVYWPSVAPKPSGLVSAQGTSQRTFSRDDTTLLSAIAALLAADFA